MSSFSPYLILAFYHLDPIEDPEAEVERQRHFLSACDATCRLYISEQGINGQLCLAVKDGLSYQEWMRGRTGFEKIQLKSDPYHEHVFPRLTIKKRPLVGYDEKIDLSQRALSLSPQEWKKGLEQEHPPLLLDVRNDYEWKLGHFEHAVPPPCQTFRDFALFAEQLKSEKPLDAPIFMYCTGGIRCELYSPILKAKGFKNVYQLQGGVIHYGHEVGSAHWLGKLFVFDDRLSVPISAAATPVIGQCHHCGEPNESYYNCANMECNELFLCCPSCLNKYSGCCEGECMKAPRLRPYHQQNPHKPFKKWYKYFPKKGKNDMGCSCMLESE